VSHPSLDATCPSWRYRHEGQALIDQASGNSLTFSLEGIRRRVGCGTLPCRAWHRKLYQIYGSASKLVGYAIQPDGALNEVTSVSIPYNSPQGLAGF
jgi:hypothetical protein